jgi:hypothetical protein
MVALDFICTQFFQGSASADDTVYNVERRRYSS